VHVSRPTITLLRTMVEASQRTEGRYDPTVLPALMEAGYRASIEDADRVTQLAPGPHRSCVGVGDVVIDGQAGSVRLPPEVAIDPGGIGKGLAADLVAEQLVRDGAAGALVSIGGDLATAGHAPHAHGWEVEVEDPHDPVRALAHLGMPCGGVATSSTISRRWRRDGTSTHHVIDPYTGVPSTTDLATVTVVAANAQPSRVPVRSRATAVSSVTTASANTTHVHALPCTSSVQSPNAPTITTTGSETCVFTFNVPSLLTDQSPSQEYPEGTITRDPGLWPMSGKTGALRLALETGAPLIPIAQWGAHEVIPPYTKAFRLLPRKVLRVTAGRPLGIDDLRGQPITKELLTEGTDRLMDAITGLLEIIRGETAPAHRLDWAAERRRASDTSEEER